MSLFNKKEPEQRKDSEQARPPVNEETRRQPVAHGYGIAEAVRLMRSLPVDQNVELVVRVIRNTLESTGVQLSSIIDDASTKEKNLQGRTEALKGEITELAAQIATRQQEISRLEAELQETSGVKERLVLAQKLAMPPTPPAGVPVVRAAGVPSAQSAPPSIPAPIKAPRGGPDALVTADGRASDPTTPELLP